MGLKNPGNKGLGRKHAVVIGSSMAGLLAGRVLADHFERVTIVERDRLPEAPEFRGGVPQARHAHVLLIRGKNIITRLFPGFEADLEAAGAISVDACLDVAWFHFGVWKARFPSDLQTYFCYRVLLEWLVRRRLITYPNISFMEGCVVTGLLSDADKTRVAGVQIRRRNGMETGEELKADLVVDASGRGSKAARWLESLGYPGPPESSVNVYVGYASRIYQRPKGLKKDWKVLVIFPKAPSETRGGVIFPIEGGRWLVTLAGYVRDYPPSDEGGYLGFARSLPETELYESIKGAQPLSSIYTYRIPGNLWRHYERMSRLPDGFVAVGDAVCSFNPLYGQGMSVCAMEAMVLERCLREQRRRSKGDLVGFSRRFQKRLAPVVETPWKLATGEDFRYPQTEGKRPPGTEFLQWYTAQVLELCSKEHKAYLRFVEVLHLLKKPAVLFHPSIAFAVLRWWLGFKAGNKI